MSGPALTTLRKAFPGQDAEEGEGRLNLHFGDAIASIRSAWRWRQAVHSSGFLVPVGKRPCTVSASPQQSLTANWFKKCMQIRRL